MWKERYEMMTDVSPAALYRAMCDVNTWSKWDTGLEYTQAHGAVKPGAPFVLSDLLDGNRMMVGTLDRIRSDSRKFAS